MITLGTYEHLAKTCYLMFCLKNEAAGFSENLILLQIYTASLPRATVISI
jgi:hypothetical protein